ncbi:LicD family protein [Proteus mirabilis]
MNKYDLRKKQLKMLKGLIEIHRICQLHNINYWLDAGTLLGAVRHSGFIPWDDDIDICMFRDDYNKFINIAKYELNTNDFFLQTVTTDKDYIFINIPCKLRINNTEIVEKFEKYIIAIMKNLIMVYLLIFFLMINILRIKIKEKFNGYCQ